MMSNTSITSTNGVTLISLIGSFFFERLIMNAIITQSANDKNLLQKLSTREKYLWESLLNLLYAITAGMAAKSPKAVANRASAIPGATIAKLVFLEIAID